MVNFSSSSSLTNQDKSTSIEKLLDFEILFFGWIEKRKKERKKLAIKNEEIFAL